MVRQTPGPAGTDSRPSSATPPWSPLPKGRHSETRANSWVPLVTVWEGEDRKQPLRPGACGGKTGRTLGRGWLHLALASAVCQRSVLVPALTAPFLGAGFRRLWSQTEPSAKFRERGFTVWMSCQPKPRPASPAGEASRSGTLSLCWAVERAREGVERPRDTQPGSHRAGPQRGRQGSTCPGLGCVGTMGTTTSPPATLLESPGGRLKAESFPPHTCQARLPERGSSRRHSGAGRGSARSHTGLELSPALFEPVSTSLKWAQAASFEGPLGGCPAECLADLAACLSATPVTHGTVT